MDFKKCERCGCFFVNDSTVCCSCETKDNLEILKLKDYFNDNENLNTVDNISINTGISTKNIYRYLNLKDFSNILNNNINYKE